MRKTLWILAALPALLGTTPATAAPPEPQMFCSDSALVVGREHRDIQGIGWEGFAANCKAGDLVVVTVFDAAIYCDLAKPIVQVSDTVLCTLLLPGRPLRESKIKP